MENKTIQNIGWGAVIVIILFMVALGIIDLHNIKKWRSVCPPVVKETRVKRTDTVFNSDTTRDNKLTIVPLADSMEPVSNRYRYSRYKFRTYGSNDSINWVLVNEGDVIQKYR